MISQFRLKLTATMVIFAICISFTIAIVDQYRLREQISNNNIEQVQLNERLSIFALETVEKVYELSGNQLAENMREKSYLLLDKYKSNPSFSDWDFAKLKEELAMDVYIINSNNVVIHSSFESDIGLDFEACCGKLVPILNERRSTGEFYHDGIETEQKTGNLKKYSYIGTEDKQYIIQLGYLMKDSTIFNEFNFLTAIEQFVNKHPSIYKINVLNIGGNRLGVPVSEEVKLTEERRTAFEHTLQTGETIELSGKWNDKPAIFRYVQYVSEYDSGSTKNKVLEIIYSEQDFMETLSSNKKLFITQLAIVLLVTIALANIITGWVSRPMYLATHDSLTGLKNRSVFEFALKSALHKSEGSTGLMMIDVDDFKQVNDRWGHDTGDKLLKCVAHSIQANANKQDTTIRLGGDEFVLIMPSANVENARNVAERIINSFIEDSLSQFPMLVGKVTLSIGVALSPEHGIDQEALTKNADVALYRSKQKGKNQYTLYETI